MWTFRAIALVIAGSALLSYAKLSGQSLNIPRQYWPRILLATLCYLVVWNITSTYAAILIPSGQAAILGFTMPIWTSIMTVIFLREAITIRLSLATLFTITSVACLMSKGLTDYAQAPLGFAMGLLSGFGWAVGTIVLKRGNFPTTAAVLTGWQLLVAAVPIGVAALFIGDHQWFVPTWQSIAVIGYIGLIPLCIGNLCWFSLVKILPANVAGLSSIMIPIVAMISGAVISQEPLGPMQLAAMFFSALALALTLIKR